MANLHEVNVRSKVTITSTLVVEVQIHRRQVVRYTFLLEGENFKVFWKEYNSVP